MRFGSVVVVLFEQALCRGEFALVGPGLLALQPQRQSSMLTVLARGVETTKVVKQQELSLVSQLHMDAGYRSRRVAGRADKRWVRLSAWERNCGDILVVLHMVVERSVGH